jgi:tyrosyl-tRNA synthetase
MGLTKPPKSDLTGIDRAIEFKMSKSDPDTSIFMLDGPDDVKRKIDKAYCPAKQISENPILEYCKYIIFELVDIFSIERPEKYGGDIEYTSYDDLERDYVNGVLNPADLKPAVATYLNRFLSPIIRHFETDEKAKKLYEFVKAEYNKYKRNEK